MLHLPLLHFAVFKIFKIIERSFADFFRKILLTQKLFYGSFIKIR